MRFFFAVSRAHNRYMARIRCAGQDTFIGYFTDPVEAARAYDAAAIRLHGQFGRLNFPRTMKEVAA